MQASRSHPEIEEELRCLHIASQRIVGQRPRPRHRMLLGRRALAVRRVRKVGTLRYEDVGTYLPGRREERKLLSYGIIMSDAALVNS